jgi:hypothetical protein
MLSLTKRKILGLIDRSNNKFFLTRKAKKIISIIKEKTAPNRTIISIIVCLLKEKSKTWVKKI